MKGEMVKTLRKQAGLSQEELAQRTGLTRRIISTIESEETAPTTKQAEALALFFGVSTDVLIFGDNSAPNNKEREYLELIRGDSYLQKQLDLLLTAKKNIKSITVNQNNAYA